MSARILEGDPRFDSVSQALIALRWEVRGDLGAAAELMPAPGGDWYLFYIEVPPAARGRGVGSALLRDLCERADAEGKALLVLPESEDAATATRLRAWYGRHGFADLPPNQFGQVGMARLPRRAS